MQLLNLKVRNLRIVEDADLDVSGKLVVLSGANGSGKTSLLEAIHLLGTGRSFRARQAQDVVRRGEDGLTVSGRFQAEGVGPLVLGVQRQARGGARYRVAGEDVRAASELARRLPLVVITPDSQRLLSDGSEGRRRLLDWLMFHLVSSYQAVHGRYRRALRQRNTMLREGRCSDGEREAWSAELAQAGEALAALRSERFGQARPALEAALSELSQLPVTLDYRSGWASGEDLLDVLLRSWEADTARGFTASGPHRADLVIRVHGKPAQNVVSRGEGKMLVFAVMAGFARTLASAIERRPVVLVDELASELDVGNRQRLSAMLAGLDLQTFITAVSDDLVDTGGWEAVVRYRLQQGKASRVLQ